ncbi:hypothetical protein DFH08DRAFT_165058 [Mycena albidolilacea]|uniref:Secreted protein n=1 Tax=Mycena albidolilacea TaxID=1033008 RepID=A0AAD7AQP4_9AGAR|nr:hypothetical protein DFH08DRAFT_165058 [Mycena albidolilacea]
MAVLHCANCWLMALMAAVPTRFFRVVGSSESLLAHLRPSSYFNLQQVGRQIKNSQIYSPERCCAVAVNSWRLLCIQMLILSHFGSYKTHLKLPSVSY